MDATQLAANVKWLGGTTNNSQPPPQNALNEGDIYELILDKPKGVVFGIAYRVDDCRRLFVTALVPHCPAEVYNRDCNVDQTLCAGDRILSVNGKVDAQEMVTELRTADSASIKFVKSGPRWHIEGITADSMEKVYRAQELGVAFELLQPEDMEKQPEETDLLPMNFMMMFVLIGLPSVFLVSAFSDVGIGFKIYAMLAPSNRNMGGNALIFFSTMTGVCLYVADWTRWDSKMKKAGTAGACVYAIIVGGFLKCRFYPQVPLVATLFHVPVFTGIMRVVFFRNMKRVSFYKGISASLMLWAFGILFIWLVWMFTGVQGQNGWKGQHTWTDATKKLLVEDAGPIYNEFKVDIQGNSETYQRRLFYDIDCNEKTKTTQVCSEQECKYHIDNMFGMPQVVGDSYGPWCCTRQGMCAKANKADDCAAALPHSSITAEMTTLVYKVKDGLRESTLCCDRTSEMLSKEKINIANKCAKVKTVWFLVWIAPFAAFGVNLLLALFCLANGVFLNTSDASKLEKTLKQFVMMVACLLLMMWVSSAIAGASMRLTGTLMAFCVSGLMCLFIWVYLEIGSTVISIGVRGSRLMQSMISLATNDWFRALMIIGMNVLIPIALVVNMMNQCARRMRGLSKSDGRFTDGMSFMLENLKNWNWSGILTKVNWWCLLYWLMSIGVAKLTSVFLSWLNEELLKIPMSMVIVIFFIIGFILFMLPPVPGLPVYMSSGVVLASRARTTSVGFFGGIMIAICLSFVLKLTACTGQYMIGYSLGKAVKIQQMVGVDKVFIKAIQQVLEMPGIPLAKVSVLVGGPDWPTSVLCGILKLNLRQILWGTCPVIFVSTPVVLSGAFMAGPSSSTADNASESGIWETLTPVMIGVAAMGQLASAVVAVYYIQEVIYSNGEELAKPREEHEPVAKLTRGEAEYNAAYNEVLDWKTLSTLNKLPILCSTAGLLFSNFVFVFMDEACFRPFAVTGSIDAPYEKGGLGKNAMSIYREPGIATHVLFILCTFVHFGFLERAKHAAKAKLKVNRRKLEIAIDEGQIACASETIRGGSSSLGADEAAAPSLLTSEGAKSSSMPSSTPGTGSAESKSSGRSSITGSVQFGALGTGTKSSGNKRMLRASRHPAASPSRV